MNKFYKTIKCLLFPNNAVTVLLVILSALLLGYAFGYEDAFEVIAYISYVLSAYTLTVVVIKMPPVIKKIKGGLYANKYSGRYLSEQELRIRISLYAGFGINIVYALVKLCAGIYLRSLWLGAIAVYYVVLSLIRFGLLKRVRYSLKCQDTKEQKIRELKTCYFCGYFMFLLNIAVTGLVVQMIWKNKNYTYPGFLIYAFAAYAFYSLTMAIINMVKFRKMDRPVLAATKVISFICALTSILTLQTALLTEFGNGDATFIQLMNSLTGSAVCLTVFVMAIWLIKKTGKEMAKVVNENGG